MDSKKKEWPKLSGKMSFKAAKGKMLPVFVEPGKLARIRDNEALPVDCDKLPYDAKNCLCRAVQLGDVVISKGGK